jgi:hypothetical protein
MCNMALYVGLDLLSRNTYTGIIERESKRRIYQALQS